MRPLLVLEDTTQPRRRLFTALGVEWWATRWAWVGPLFWVALGCVVAWAEAELPPAAALRGAETDAGALPVLLAGAGYGLVLWLANVIHTLGHVASSLLAGTPMDAVVVTATRDVTVYRGAKGQVAERIRVVRSLGGPVANAMIGSAALWAAALLSGAGGTPAGAHGASAGSAGWLWAVGAVNLCIAGWTLMPVPTLDGWIVWRWIFRRGRPAP